MTAGLTARTRPLAPWEVAAQAPDEPATEAGGPPLRWGRVLIILISLSMFGQMFAYVKSFPLLWSLSKVWPVMALPLSLVLFRFGRPPVARQVAFTFLWMVLVSSIAGQIVFGQDFFLGLTSQVKLLPILSFFSFLGLLCLLQPTLRELTTAFLIGGLVTVAVLGLLSLLAPQSWYAEVYVAGDAPVLSRDGRGNRIRMPMYLGLFLAFYGMQAFMQTRRLVWLLLPAIIFAMVLGIVRQRAMILGFAGVAGVFAFRAAGPWQRILVGVAVLPVALWALFQSELVSSVFNTGQEWGFDTRRISIRKAIEFLGSDPFRWIFGVGSLSPLDPAAMMKFFNHFFFLADITWLGVTFEFGLIGAILVLMLPVRGIVMAQRLSHGVDAPFVGAAQDYLIYAIFISPLYPLTLVPGEVTVLLASLVYIRALLPTEYDELGRR